VSDTVFIDGSTISIFALLMLAVSWFIWGRWLNKLDPRYQRVLDVLAIIASGSVILLIALLHYVPGLWTP
jgi:hypothetical protein